MLPQLPQESFRLAIKKPFAKLTKLAGSTIQNYEIYKELCTNAGLFV
jgi:hypothetical protein